MASRQARSTTPAGPGRRATSRRVDDCLSIRDGRLFVEECDAVALARAFGTPAYVVSENQLRRNARRWLATFTRLWPGRVDVLPSIKANFALALRRILSQEGMGCDAFGMGELRAALASGVPPRLISANGSCKDRAFLELAIHAGARITLDSAAEIDGVRTAANRCGKRALVRFRLRPPYSGLQQRSGFARGDVSIFEMAQRYKPGIPTEELIGAGRRALAMGELDVTGTMAHLGRHHTDLEVWRGMIRDYVSVVATLRDAWDGWEPREIDVGGGFPTPRDPFGRASTAHPLAAAPPPLRDYAEVVTDTLAEELARHGLGVSDKTLEVEPGRGLYADAGIHLATVRSIKAQASPVERRWVETDTSEAFLPDGLIEHNLWTYHVANKGDAPQSLVADIVGISCGFDIIVPDARLPSVERGDVIAFLDTGAYQDAGASNFNALPRPATILVCDAEAETIKRAETIEDVFRRDTIPARLAPVSEAVDAEPHTVIRLDDGDEGAEEQRVRAVVGLDHVSVTTADLDRSLGFYESLLHLEVLGRGELEGDDIEGVTGIDGARAKWADLDLGNEQVLELVQFVAPRGRALRQRPFDPGSGHLAVAVRDTSELYARLAGAGFTPHGRIVSITEPGYWNGARCFYVSDPDGVTVEIIERARSRDEASISEATGRAATERLP